MPALTSSRGGGRMPNREESTLNNQDIQNDIILRESAYIADQLLKRLAPAQPVFHHTELMPIRQNRAEAPTAQILSPKTSPLIQKPPPPQLASMRSKMHFNNNLPIPQLKDARYLTRKAQRSEEDKIDPRSGEQKSNLPLRSNFLQQDQTLPTVTRAHSQHEDESQVITNQTKDEFVNSQTSGAHQLHVGRKGFFKPSRDHIPTPGPGAFPYFPSQRLAPPVPSKISATAQAMDAAYHNYQHQQQGGNLISSKSRRTGHEESRATKSQAERKAAPTGKRRPGQGVTIGMAGHVTVPVIGPPPPERRWRYKRRGPMGKGARNGTADASHRDYHEMQRRDSEPGWEEVQVRGGGASGHLEQDASEYGGVSRAHTT